MTLREDSNVIIDGLVGKQGQVGSVTPSTLGDDRLRPLLVNTLMIDEQANIDLNGDEYSIKPDPTTGILSLFRTEGAITVFIGEIGGGFTDQLVFIKPLGGLRFKDATSGFEFFVCRRDVSGDALGAVFGNFDTVTGNFFATSDTGGLTVCQKTDTDIVDNIGNAGSSNFIESTLFSFQYTSDQVKPFGALVQNFVGETDVDFVDVPFDTRILDSTGVTLYSDIQNIELFQQNPSASPFKLTSVAGVVTLPASQPFPMDSASTYTIEYEFATAIRLKGDGAQPALAVNSKRLEYFAVNYRGGTEIKTANFIAESGHSYKVDTSGGVITATAHETVESVNIGDFDLTLGSPNNFILDFGALGTIIFGTQEKGNSFEVVRFNSGYRVYNADGSLHSTLP